MSLTIFEALNYAANFISLYVLILCLSSLIKNRKELYCFSKTNHFVFPKVCIIVPCCNEEKTIEGTVNSLIELDYPKDKLEIMIVDDGSTDNTLKIAKKFENHQSVKIHHKENGGKHTALNYGIKKTDAEFIGCLDADSFVKPCALKKIINYFNKKETMAVAPSIKIYRPKTIFQRLQQAEYLSGIFLRKSFSLLDSMYVMPGAFTVFRKEIFDKMGLYKSAHQTEDIEMTLRLQKNNIKLTNALDVSVYTVGPDSFYKLHRQRIRWFKGFLKNFWDYRFFFFNKKYGDLGVLLPLMSFTVFLTFFIVIYTMFNAIYNEFVFFQNLPLINFDIFHMFSFDPRFNWFFLNSNPFVFLNLFILTTTVGIIFLGNKLSLEKKDTVSKRGILFFVLFYLPLWFIWWSSVFYSICFKKEVIWKK